MDMNTTDVETLSIVLVCPGPTEWDAQQRIVGNLDVPMTPEGEAQVRRTAEELRDLPIGRIYAAPGMAGEATARALADGGHVKIRFDDRLSNMNFGLWQGKRLEELKACFPKQFKKWQEIPRSLCPPDGETLDDVADRARQFLSWILKKHRDGCIAVVVAEPMASILKNVVLGEPVGTDWHIMGHQSQHLILQVNPHDDSRLLVSSSNPVGRGE